jgi:hypothetical protein
MLRSKLTIALAAAAILGVASALAIEVNQPAEPGLAGAQAIPQTASAQSDDLVLSAVSATFSGSETIVELRLEPSPELRLKLGDVYTPEFPRTAVSTEGFEGVGFQIMGWKNERLLIGLPPISGQATPKFTASLVQFRTSTGPVRVSGAWELSLSVPDGSAQAILRTEAFAPVAVVDGAIPLTISGRRSASRTIIEYSLPPGVTELAPPRISAPGSHDVVLPISTATTKEGRSASFQMTPFGEKVIVSFGPFAVAESIPAAVIPLEVASGGPGDARVNYTSAGAPIQVVSAAVDQSESRAWLRVVLQGNWSPESFEEGGLEQRLTWEIRTSDGQTLEPKGWGEHFTKGTDGSIGYGQTVIDVYLPGPTLPSPLALEIKSRTTIISGPWQAELEPVKAR